jgi:hypothetical protein
MLVVTTSELAVIVVVAILLAIVTIATSYSQLSI